MSLTDYIFNSEVGKIKIDFPSLCNSNCIGCYCHALDKDPRKKLPLDIIEKILEDAKGLGIKQIVIAADGEPLMDKDYFFRVVNSATQSGIESLVYTNGSRVTLQIAKMLHSLNTSLLVKRNSMDHERQNNLSRANLSPAMLEGLENLLKVGFNGSRLAIESFVSKKNVNDLCDVLRYCRKKGIVPYFEEFISINQSEEVRDRMVLTPEQLLESFLRYQQIDHHEFGIEVPVISGSRRYGIPECSLRGLVSIDTDGNVKKCILDESYGNIKREKFIEIYVRIPEGCGGCSVSVSKS